MGFENEDGGGPPSTLNQVLVSGPNTGGEDIIVDNADSILFGADASQTFVGNPLPVCDTITWENQTSSYDLTGQNVFRNIAGSVFPASWADANIWSQETFAANTSFGFKFKPNANTLNYLFGITLSSDVADDRNDIDYALSFNPANTIHLVENGAIIVNGFTGYTDTDDFIVDYSGSTKSICIYKNGLLVLAHPTAYTGVEVLKLKSSVFDQNGGLKEFCFNPGVFVLSEALLTGHVFRGDMFSVETSTTTLSATDTLKISGGQVSIEAPVTVRDQDLEVVNSLNGVIWESPDGTRWKVTMANGGSFVFTSLP